MDPKSFLIEQAHGVVALLSGAEQVDGRRLVTLCAALFERERADGKLVATTDDLALKRELGQLVEYLSRRSSTAIGLATLGRAGLAELSGDVKSAESLRREFELKLSLLGL